MRIRILAALCLLLLPAPAARADDGEMIARDAETENAPWRLIETPLSLSVVSAEEITRAQPSADLEEALALVPGVFAQSSRNSAQDTRISIRGFGARSSFGVRGVRVLIDGIPSTLPDGQSEVDSLELSFVDRIHVVRGPISSLYGGGGGGIVSVSTLQPTKRLLVRLRTVFGTDHQSRYEASTTGTFGGAGYVFGVARSRYSGYREHARSEQTAILAKLEREIGSGTLLGVRFSSVWAPEGQDPMGLNKGQVDADRGQAHSRAFRFGAGEKLNQQKIAVSLRRALAPGSDVEVRGYRLWRDFSNALPFTTDSVGNGGRIDFDRTVTGGSVLWKTNLGPARLMLGGDIDVQQDRRRRYENNDGARGALTFRQSETVRSFGPFAQAELDLPGGFGVVGGLRYDWTEFDAGDRFGANGDQSATIRFRELSPRIGLRYGTSAAFQAYANLSTSFQVPTTVELRPPDEPAGFNSQLEPERAMSVEIGIKGSLDQRWFYDVAIFHIRIKDVIVPFDDLPGATFARNAAEVYRRGGEIALSGLLAPGLSVRAAYTYADYRYHDYDSPVGFPTGEADGKREPNVPLHHASAELRWEHESGLFSVMSLRHFSDIEVDDLNRNESPGATLSNARFGFDWRRGDVLVRPFVGIQNWSGVEYNGALRPNGGFSRFYEPAPESQVYGGLEIRFALDESPY